MIGPHFYFDLIRLPRKGWSTFFRCLYLLILLTGLALMYESRRHNINDAAGYSRFAHAFAYTLVALQDVMILALLPVYVASAIAEERENRTIETLFLLPLTNWQIVLGKFLGRLLHLGAIVLAGVPLLAFTHLWGGVAISFLAYHTLNTLLLVMTGSGMCILISSQKATVSQAVIGAYPWILGLGFVNEIVAFVIPWLFHECCLCMFACGKPGTTIDEAPFYLGNMALLVPVHLFLTYRFVSNAIAELDFLRCHQDWPGHKTTVYFAYADDHRSGGARALGSRINPLALPIKENALFWKECLKDGTYLSLSWPWLGISLLTLAAICVVSQFFIADARGTGLHDIRVVTASFAYAAYFIGMATYALLVIFQTTMSVVRERERHTLDFLLMLPVGRREILFCKWLGPLWRNWPILAIAYLGVLLGAGTQVYSPLTALVLIVLPWPFLLMCSGVSLLLSVLCQRTLFANVIVLGILLVLVMAHVVASQFLTGLLPAYAALLFELRQPELAAVDMSTSLALFLIEQSSFLVVAAACAALALLAFAEWSRSQGIGWK